MKTAQRLLVDLARRLETEHPSAAESVRERLDETLTVLTLNLSARLRRSLATTNAAESLLSRTRHVKRNVKVAGGQMMLRWVAAGVVEAVKGFRRVKDSRHAAAGWSPRSVPVIVSSVWPSLKRSDKSRSRQPSRRRISTLGHPPGAPQFDLRIFVVTFRRSFETICGICLTLSD